MIGDTASLTPAQRREAEDQAEHMAVVFALKAIFLRHLEALQVPAPPEGWAAVAHVLAREAHHSVRTNRAGWYQAVTDYQQLAGSVGA